MNVKVQSNIEQKQLNSNNKSQKMVYVLSNKNVPLMPCTCVIARILLRDKKAKVLKRTPFTIKLLNKPTEYIQKLTLAVDTGTGGVGYSVINNKNEVLYMSEVEVRNDISDKMDRRRKYRRSRRNRKTRYRKCRFLNRKNSKRKDRFSPTMQSKLHSHVKEIEYIKKIMPISVMTFEVGNFDPHLMKNPALANKKIRPWGYQRGPNYGFENTKAMVLARDEYTCQLCKGKHKDSKLEVHHIIYRRNGGSDEAENLITLCHTCHKNLHADNSKKLDKKILKIKQGKVKGTLKYATQMNSIRTQLMKLYPKANITYGYITKANRLNLNIEKEHHLDACVIASQGKPFEIKCSFLKKKCVAKGDFQKTKGIRSEQPITTGKIQGFRKYNKVEYFGKEYFIKGRMSSGYAILMDIDGKKIDFSNMPKGFKTPKLANLKRIGARKSWLIEEISN